MALKYDIFEICTSKDTFEYGWNTKANYLDSVEIFVRNKGIKIGLHFPF